VGRGVSRRRPAPRGGARAIAEAEGRVEVDEAGELRILPPPTRPDPGTRAWYEEQLRDVEAALGEAKPGEVASLHRRLMAYAEKIAAMRAEEEPNEELSGDELRAKLQSEALQLADAYLEVFVEEYCRRHRLKLVRDAG
jgi:hypothetical protein